MWAEQGSILRFVILIDFFLGPWLDVCQFVEISNQMGSNGEVSNFENKNLFNTLLYEIFVVKVWYLAIWLYLIGNFYELAY